MGRRKFIKEEDKSNWNVEKKRKTKQNEKQQQRTDHGNTKYTSF